MQIEQGIHDLSLIFLLLILFNHVDKVCRVLVLGRFADLVFLLLRLIFGGG